MSKDNRPQLPRRGGSYVLKDGKPELLGCTESIAERKEREAKEAKTKAKAAGDKAGKK